MGRQFKMEIDDSMVQTLIVSDSVSDVIQTKNLRVTTREMPVVTRWDAEVTARILDASVTIGYSDGSRNQGATRHDSPRANRRDGLVTEWNSPVTSWYLRNETRPMRDSAVTLVLTEN